MTYSSEQELVNDFIARLTSIENPWGSLDVVREFFYHRGRVDVVAVCSDGHVVAFEAKLTRWRDALQQAYRNTCFAHRSYVLLPWDVAQVALRYSAEFEKRRVGLCAVVGNDVLVLHDARTSDPLQPWLAEAVSIEASAKSGTNATAES